MQQVCLVPQKKVLPHQSHHKCSFISPEIPQLICGVSAVFYQPQQHLIAHHPVPKPSTPVHLKFLEPPLGLDLDQHLMASSSAPLLSSSQVDSGPPSSWCVFPVTNNQRAGAKICTSDGVGLHFWDKGNKTSAPFSGGVIAQPVKLCPSRRLTWAPPCLRWEDPGLWGRCSPPDVPSPPPFRLSCVLPFLPGALTRAKSSALTLLVKV